MQVELKGRFVEMTEDDMENVKSLVKYWRYILAHGEVVHHVAGGPELRVSFPDDMPMYGRGQIEQLLSDAVEAEGKGLNTEEKS